LLRVNSERVNVDTISRGVGVVLIGLDIVEVSTFTSVESVVTVELNEGPFNRVDFTIDENTKVEGFIDARVVAVATGIGHELNRDGKIANSEVSVEDVNANIIT